jgi:protocatechuate 3,4-dioxygenase, alpha subunit
VTAHPLTPSQTVGPFFHDCMLRDGAVRAVIGDDAGGAHVQVGGRVLDGDGAGVPDAVIEVWQTTGFARVGTDDQGRFSFTATRASHVSVAVFARGLLNHLFTRIYFEDEPVTDTDPVLSRVPEARRGTLVATPEPGGGLTRSYRFDIVLQGDSETVFFDFRASPP